MFLKILALFTFVSCSFVSNKGLKEVSYVGVNLDSKQSGQVQVKKTINTQEDKSTNTEKPFGVFIGPGLYDVSMAIGSLKYLETKDQKINIISGNGLGLILAFLYSYKGSVSLLEWEWFKLLNEINIKDEIYSKNWKRSITRYLKKNFGKVRFIDLKTAFFIPLKDMRSKKIKFISNKNVVPYLIEAIDFTNSERKEFSSTLPTAVFPIGFYKDYRVNNVVVINTMDEGVNYNFKSDYLKRKVREIAEQSERELSDLEYVVNLKSDKRYQTDRKRSLGLVNEGFLQSKQRLSDILIEINETK